MSRALARFPLVIKTLLHQTACLFLQWHRCQVRPQFFHAAAGCLFVSIKDCWCSGPDTSKKQCKIAKCCFQKREQNCAEEKCQKEICHDVESWLEIQPLILRTETLSFPENDVRVSVLYPMVLGNLAIYHFQKRNKPPLIYHEIIYEVTQKIFLPEQYN